MHCVDDIPNDVYMKLYFHFRELERIRLHLSPSDMIVTLNFWLRFNQWLNKEYGCFTNHSGKYCFKSEKDFVLFHLKVI